MHLGLYFTIIQKNTSILMKGSFWWIFLSGRSPLYVLVARKPVCWVFDQVVLQTSLRSLNGQLEYLCTSRS